MFPKIVVPPLRCIFWGHPEHRLRLFFRFCGGSESFRTVLGGLGAVLVESLSSQAASQAASQPGSQSAWQPASLPASQPASQPTGGQRTRQPASQTASIAPHHLSGLCSAQLL